MKFNLVYPKAYLLPIIFLLSFLSLTEPSVSAPKKALFNTKVEAEKAAKDFGCSGAHKMGKKWMPCSMHQNNHNH